MDHEYSFGEATKIIQSWLEFRLKLAFGEDIDLTNELVYVNKGGVRSE